MNSVLRRVRDLLAYASAASGGDKPLGARLLPEKPWVEKYPLSALPADEAPVGVPVTIGVNWYPNFDNPIRFGTRYWIGVDSSRKPTRNLGRVRGGHCVCVKSSHQSDYFSWWTFYNQGAEGACVGFGSSRMMSLLNRKRYDARWLWDMAKLVDEWRDTNPGDDNGTSVHAAMGILSSRGHVPWKTLYDGRDFVARDQEVAVTAEGISAYRWAKTVDEMRLVLDSPLHDQLQAVPILNSWGRDYPHLVWMPYEVMSRLLGEDGEVALVTDR